MLTRAARRRHALRYVEQAAEKIQLPWLCPALVSPSLTIQRRTTSTRPSLPRPQRFPSQSPLSRRLASAASITDDFNHHDEYLPFSYERHFAPNSRRHDEPVPFADLANILMIDQTTQPAPLRSISNTSVDLRGDVLDIEATLEACLQVQRWDRSFHILKQLSRILVGNTNKLQQMYNRVLEAMVFDLVWNRNTQNQDKINKWIEVHMKKVGVEPNAQTFALKIKVALATLNGSRRDRTVKRYWDMAKKYRFENQVASMRDILSDSDLGKLTEICPLEIDFELEQDIDLDQPEIAQEQVLQNSSDPTAIRETDQKGLGLISLRQSLASFKSTESSLEDLEQREALAMARQAKLEQDSLQSAVDRWRIENEKRMKMGVSGNLQHGKIGALTWQWHETLIQKIEKELKLVDLAEASTKKTPEDRLRCEYGPFLRLLSPQHLAALTTISLVQTMSKLGVAKSVKLARLVVEMGRVVEVEVESHKNKAKKSVKKAKQNKEASNATVEENAAGPVLHSSHFGEQPLWSNLTVGKVGAILCELLFDTAKMSISKEDSISGKKLTITESVFQNKIIYVHGRKVATISLIPEFAQMLVHEPPADIIAKQLPMVSTPKPWAGFTEGGYLETSQPVLRVKHNDAAQRDYAKAAAERGDLDQVYKGLDVLGRTGWTINRNVFNVMLDAWNSGEAVANLPPINKVFAEIEKPAEDAKSKDKWSYYTKLRAIENERGGLHSKRCFQNFQMEIARSYLNETFYLPHNVDFRGRAYPIPPYLNQMGADNARGLLLFAEGRELGPTGLKWLAVHLSNVFGYDKASLSDRAQFSFDHIADIRDSVNKPLTGKRWWLTAEDPWQCLATCHEFLSAVDSPDPTKFVSYLPVHQDGTCNGLQHYAALGGDVAGARQVNLQPGDKPADVYTGVAELVKAGIKEDAQNGMEIAKLLDGRLTRKIVKQTVMTNVYGVTFTGAIRQVRKQVDDLLPDIKQSGQAGQAATYIARKIFKGLGTLFESAHDIQYWLGDCANRITHSISPAQLEQLERKEFGGVQISEKPIRSNSKRNKQGEKVLDNADFRSPVIWTTPLGLPVVQPYRTSTSEAIYISAQKLNLTQPNVADAVDPRKQLQGFPPNFIHSLDATHMMLSALKASELGLSFSAVHDSFWTHAADVNTLNVLLRAEFIRMHSEDIIGRLAAEFKARYKGHWYLAKVGRGSTLYQKVLEYRKEQKVAGSNTKKQRYVELAQEVKRMRLLASEDPEERKEGEAMVTGSSLFEKYGGEQCLATKVTLGQTAIGEVPETDPLAVEDMLEAEGIIPDEFENDTHSVAEAQPEKIKSKSKSKSKQSDKDTNSTWLWLPLTFKEVPKKGEFNVEILRDSTYFFS